jgi:hypothetical protein
MDFRHFLQRTGIARDKRLNDYTTGVENKNAKAAPKTAFA